MLYSMPTLLLLLEARKAQEETGEDENNDLSGAELAGFFFVVFFLSMIVFCCIYLWLGDGRIKQHLAPLIDKPAEFIRKISNFPSAMKTSMFMTRAPLEGEQLREGTQASTYNPTFMNSGSDASNQQSSPAFVRRNQRKSISEAIHRNQRLSIDENNPSRNNSWMNVAAEA